MTLKIQVLEEKDLQKPFYTGKGGSFKLPDLPTSVIGTSESYFVEVRMYNNLFSFFIYKGAQTKWCFCDLIQEYISVYIIFILLYIFTIYYQQTMTFEDNIHVYDDSAERVKSPVQSFSISVNGQELKVEGLDEPIEITVPVAGTVGDVHANYSRLFGEFYYHSFRVEEDGVALFIDFYKAVNPYVAYVKLNLRPNATDYDYGPIQVDSAKVRYVLPADDLDDHLNSDRKVYIALRPQGEVQQVA